MKYILGRFVFLMIMISFITGCRSDDPILVIQHEFPHQIWTWSNPITFDFVAPDTLDHYNLYLNIFNEKDYPFQNLYTKIVTHFPNGDSTLQILSLDIYDKKGRQNGECSSSICSSEFVMQENFSFLQEGNHRIVLYQQMREDSLKFIHGMKLKLYREKQL